MINKINISDIPKELHQILSDYSVATGKPIGFMQLGSNSYTLRSIKILGGQLRLYLMSHHGAGEHRFSMDETKKLTISINEVKS